MENIVEWIRLSVSLGGTNAGGALVRKYGSAEKIFEEDPELLYRAGDISADAAKKLAGANRAKAQGIASECRNFGWSVITPESAYYPSELKKISDLPLVLYVCGDPSFLIAEHKAAVVGTRKPSDISIIAAYKLSAALSEKGITTVSGGAIGIDRASHEGALTGPGSTVCVLGNGLGFNYLPERVFLRRRIEKNGAVVSEMEPFEGPRQYSFPRRNRIIAALSKTLTVVESGAKGGSLISADYAVKYNKRVFALSPGVYPSRGCEKLINEGAVELCDASQVINRYISSGAPVPLANSGEDVPKILKPESCTLQEFASLNGVTPSEALPLFETLAHTEKAGSDPQTKAAPASKPEKKAAPKPKTKKTEYTEPNNILKENVARTQGLSPAEKTLYMCLGKDPESLDRLAEKTGLSVPQLMSAATALELMELAASHPGNRFSLK